MKKNLLYLLFTSSVFFTVHAALAQTPGGAGGNFVAWLTPESYDGNVWANLATGTSVGNFSQVGLLGSTINAKPPVKVDRGYNFHQSLFFEKTTNTAAPNRLQSAMPYSHMPADNVTAIFVLKRRMNSYSGGGLLSLWNASGNTLEGDIYWNNANNGRMYYQWNGTTDRLNNNLYSATEGLVTIDNANDVNTSTTGGIDFYVNGGKLGRVSSGTGKIYDNGSRIVIGGVNYRYGAGYGYEGDLQEVIILKGNPSVPNSHLSTLDFQKIHSYLAIKYGITLEGNPNYVNSDGTVVWLSDATYKKNIFGIGWDNNGGLNQKQSKSNNSDVITAFIGELRDFNHQNTAIFPADKTALVFGSNGLAGEATYNFNLNSQFANGTNSQYRLNCRTNEIWKTQSTINGAAATVAQIINIRVNNSFVKYVLVCPNTNFNAADTRIYEVDNYIADTVRINNGDFVSLGKYVPTPGGADGSFVAWLTPDTYNGLVWANQALGTSAVGDFSQNGLLGSTANVTPPAKVNRGYNYHPSLCFEKASNNDALNRLQSATAYTHALTDNLTTIFVLKRKLNSKISINGLLSLNNSTGNYYDGDIEWRNASTNQLWYYWNGNNDRFGAAAYGADDGVITIDNSNSPYPPATGGINLYHNGEQKSSTKTTGASYAWSNDSRVVIGGTYSRYGAGYGYLGDIQEIIILKTVGANSHLSKTDFQKIHSYLGLKYGITIKLNDANDNYINSLGDTVWHYDNKYNSHIFGLGRDDASGLYQKQAISATHSVLKMFVGSKIEALNSQNTAELTNRKYLVVAHDGSHGWFSHNIMAGTMYENGAIGSDLNFHSGVYKAEVSGGTDFTVKFSVANSLSYIAVSKTDAFDPATTRLFQLTAGIGEVTLTNEWRYFRFSGYSAGPGNVGRGLNLWLRADDANMLTIQNTDKNDDESFDGFPTAEKNAVPGTTLPAVVSWNDYIRNQDYTFTNAYAAHNGARKPVFKEASPEMNFHPGLRFYHNGKSTGSTLRNNNGIMSTAATGSEHTAIFVLNSAFDKSNTNNWLYPMSFNSNIGSWDGPQYGFQRDNSGNMLGRMRLTSTIDLTGSTNLYRAGSTSILQFDFSYLGKTITFNFNGKTETITHSLNSMPTPFMSGYSNISGGFAYDRVLDGVMSEVIIYEGIISDVEREQIDGYLALKYGTTMSPLTGGGRYDYTIKNGSIYVWRGKTDATGKYANYYNNVAAVVRDDGTILNNRQSHSTNAGSILHLGVAGTALGGEADELGELEDGEAVAFGHNGSGGITPVSQICGGFQSVFNRNWLVHKVTNGNRPAPMLVGIENNSGNLLGNNESAATSADKEYYNEIIASKEFAMFVSDDSTKINPNHANFALNDFKVIPMQYINGEWQCNYTFTKEDTYITFAFKSSAAICNATAQFAGTKTFSWTQWKYPTHKKSGKQGEGLSFTQSPVDLGDGITAVTSVNYAPKVRAYYGYPAVVKKPKDALEIRRSYGSVGDKVTIIIEFNDVVIPEFSISGIDGYAHNYDEVTIYGSCGASGGGSVNPILKAEGIKPVFTISGNKATANQRKSLSATDKNGTLNVSFETGIRTVTIEYTLQNRANGYVQKIIVSPITIRQGALPPPLINIDGIAFQQQAKNKTISSCDQIEYTFLIQNTNMHDKYFNFRDTLPDWLTWQAESVGIDVDNPKMQLIADYGGNRILALDSILVPCVSTVKITAIAEPDDKSSGLCINSAFLNYKNDEKRDTVIVSMDAETREMHTDVDVIYEESYFPLEISHSEPNKYQDDDTVTILLKAYNPNIQNIRDLYLNISWGSNFKYVTNSLKINGDSVEAILPLNLGYANVQPEVPYAPSDTIQSLLIAGEATGDTGFSLTAQDTTFIEFKVKAPSLADLEYQTDEITGLPTNEVSPLIVEYDFFMDSPDICALYALTKTEGIMIVPFRGPLYIDSIRYNIGPNVGGSYIGESGSRDNTTHWGINTNGRVTIYGGGFQLGGNLIDVYFGGIKATVTRCDADDSIRVIPPAVVDTMVFRSNHTTEYGGEGKVDVTVTVGGGLFTATLNDGYTYRSPIVIDSIKPDNGPVSGGTEVIIRGHNFIPPAVFPPASVYVIFETVGGASDTIPVTSPLNDTLVVFTMPHLVSASRIWVDNLLEKTDTVFTFYPNVFIEDGKWTEYWKWENHTNENILPYPLADIHIKANVVQDTDVNMNSITVYAAKAYTVDTARTVKTNEFTLQDNASFLNYGKDSIVTARVLHTLAQGRNWYVSSPMQGSVRQEIDPVFVYDTLGNNLNTLVNQGIPTNQDKKWRVEWYDETKAASSDVHGYGKWELMMPTDTLATGRGYVAYSDSADIAVRFTGRFTDGKTASPLSPMLTNTADGHPKRAFNLVGNPYPSYWRWTATAATGANTYSTIWYRTNIAVSPNRNAYQFWAYNAAGDVAVAPGWEDETQVRPYSLAYIPPMQAFWVKLQETASGGRITFDNARRSHSNNVSNILKSKKQGEKPLLRLVINSDKNVDETLIYADDNAQTYFDDYDSEKLFSGSGAEIYTMGDFPLAINGLPHIYAGLEIPLGFTADQSGAFALHAVEITNIDTLDVMLLDKWRNEEFDLRGGNSYNFIANSNANTGRFSIVFRRKSPSGINNAVSRNVLLAYCNVPRHITVLLSDGNLHGKTVLVQVFDIWGRKFTEQTIAEGDPTTLAAVFTSGVYIVKAGARSERVVVK